MGIKMTAPVATKIEGNKYTMCFYLPKKAQENCPKPINDDVFIYSKPTMKIFKLGEKITGYKDEHFDSIKEKLEMRIEEEGIYINGYNKDFLLQLLILTQQIKVTLTVKFGSLQMSNNDILYLINFQTCFNTLFLYFKCFY